MVCKILKSNWFAKSIPMTPVSTPSRSTIRNEKSISSVSSHENSHYSDPNRCKFKLYKLYYMPHNLLTELACTFNIYFRYTKGRWSTVPKHSIIHWSSLLTVYITHVPNTLLQKIIRIKNSKDHKSLFTTGQRSEFFRKGNFLCLNYSGRFRPQLVNLCPLTTGHCFVCIVQGAGGISTRVSIHFPATLQ